MKLQNLTVIFIIIIIPIILIFTYYISLQSKTIKLQTDYDEKLIEATREGVEAFEINTTEWNSKYSTLANSKRRDLLSSVNVFTTSLSNKLGMGGMSKENILNYIPAIVYIMYDGYYIYSPTYVPKTLTNDNGVQLFYYENAEDDARIAAKATQEIEGKIYPGKPIYFLKSGQSDIIKYNEVFYTTDIAKADKTYRHVLKTFVPYTAQIGDYTINYTLDGYIRVFGNGETREGYVIENIANILNKQINSDNDNGINYIEFEGKIISPEILTENIPIKQVDETIKIETYRYIYNSNNDKRYYDSNNSKFFTINNDTYEKVYLPEADVESGLAEYKRVFIKYRLPGPKLDWQVLGLYQLLNKDEENVWYYKNNENSYVKYMGNKPNIDREKDCSAINYYLENYSFNKWLKNKGLNSNFLNNKKQYIVDNINKNLKLSIANYSANSKIDYELPELTETDWEQALSNISMIAFFQGVKTGLKTYNNYAIVTSTENNEYVAEDSLYYMLPEDHYHRYDCKSMGNAINAYKNTEFKVQNYIDKEKDTDTGYYFKHAKYDNETGKLEKNYLQCFDCIVNRNNMEMDDESDYNVKIKYTALARERYIQMKRISLSNYNGSIIEEVEPEPEPELEQPEPEPCSHEYNILNATCAQDKYCKKCNYIAELKTNNHSWENDPANSRGKYYHIKKCTICDKTDGDRELCTSDSWTHDDVYHYGQCSTCGQAIKEKHLADRSALWSKDNNKHWKYCYKCRCKILLEKHDYQYLNKTCICGKKKDLLVE